MYPDLAQQLEELESEAVEAETLAKEARRRAQLLKDKLNRMSNHIL